MDHQLSLCDALCKPRSALLAFALLMPSKHVGGAIAGPYSSGRSRL